MKIIGKINYRNYICEVNHEELEKFLNLYYNKLKEPMIGDVIDLSKGYNFYRDTKEALQETSIFIKANKKVIDTITDAFIILGTKVDE